MYWSRPAQTGNLSHTLHSRLQTEGDGSSKPNLHIHCIQLLMLCVKVTVPDVATVALMSIHVNSSDEFSIYVLKFEMVKVFQQLQSGK